MEKHTTNEATAREEENQMERTKKENYRALVSNEVESLCCEVWKSRRELNTNNRRFIK